MAFQVGKSSSPGRLPYDHEFRIEYGPPGIFADTNALEGHSILPGTAIDPRLLEANNIDVANTTRTLLVPSRFALPSAGYGVHRNNLFHFQNGRTNCLEHDFCLQFFNPSEPSKVVHRNIAAMTNSDFEDTLMTDSDASAVLQQLASMMDLFSSVEEAPSRVFEYTMWETEPGINNQLSYADDRNQQRIEAPAPVTDYTPMILDYRQRHGKLESPLCTSGLAQSSYLEVSLTQGSPQSCLEEQSVGSTTSMYQSQWSKGSSISIFRSIAPKRKYELAGTQSAQPTKLRKPRGVKKCALCRLSGIRCDRVDRTSKCTSCNRQSGDLTIARAPTLTIEFFDQTRLSEFMRKLEKEMTRKNCCCHPQSSDHQASILAVLCHFQPLEVGRQPNSQSSNSQPIVLMPNASQVRTEHNNFGYPHYELNRAQMRQFMRSAILQRLPSKIADVWRDEDCNGVVWMALLFKGWYGIISDIEGNPIRIAHRTSACETKHFTQSIFKSICIVMGEILEQLVAQINESSANGNLLGHVLCAIAILGRYMNQHKRHSRERDPDNTSNVDGMMHEFEAYVHERTQELLRYLAAFKNTYGAHFCTVDEDNYQPWIDLIGIQSQPKLSVSILIEKESPLLFLPSPIEVLSPRPFTQLLDSELSSLEHYLADLKLGSMSTPNFHPMAVDTSPSQPLSEELLQRLEIELGSSEGDSFPHFDFKVKTNPAHDEGDNNSSVLACDSSSISSSEDTIVGFDVVYRGRN